MQNISTIHTAVKGNITPEDDEAIRAARSASWRLEAEYYHLDIEARFELAEDLRQLLGELPDQPADITATVISDLEDIDFADFSDWNVRADASARMLRVVRALESDRQEVRVHA